MKIKREGISSYRALVVVVLLAMVAGAAGAAGALRYLPEFQPIVSELVRPAPQVRSPSKLSDAIESASANVVFFVKPSAGATFTTTEDRVGLGVVLTSDGLVATTSSLNPRALPKATTFSRNVFEVELMKGSDGKVLRDPRLGLTFVKLKAANLKAVPFAKFEEVEVADEVFAFGRDGTLQTMKVRAVSFPVLPEDLVESSERLTSFILVDGETEEGTPVYTSEGALLGISLGEGRVVPAELIQSVMGNVVKQGSVKRTYLGAHGVELGAVVPLKEGMPKHGFLLKSGKAGPAVVAGSPAAKAGLASGDIIVTLDGQRISSPLPLALLLARYPAGVEVELVLLRSGKEEKVKVVLGEK